MNWDQFIEQESEKEYFRNLQTFLEHEDRTKTVYPDLEDTLRAFDLTPFDQVKVVILGQDPYHGEYQANGLAFSVDRGVKVPPSLKNIYKELCDDLGCDLPEHGDLTSWAEQGVLLLNTTLTVRKGEPGSHYGMGWETFTSAALRLQAKRDNPPLFVLWGKKAYETFLKAVEEDCVEVNFLYTSHPSPFSFNKGFFGCSHFSSCNKILKAIGKKPIRWESICD